MTMLTLMMMHTVRVRAMIMLRVMVTMTPTMAMSVMMPSIPTKPAPVNDHFTAPTGGSSARCPPVQQTLAMFSEPTSVLFQPVVTIVAGFEDLRRGRRLGLFSDSCMRRGESACKLRHMSVNGGIQDDDDDGEDYDDHDVAVLW